MTKSRWSARFYNWEPKTLNDAMNQILTPCGSPEEFDRRGREDAGVITRLVNKLKPSGMALDFGCGIGRVLRHLPYDRFDGYEPNEGMRKFHSTWLGASHKVYKEIGEIPSTKYDFVFEMLVFQHVPFDELEKILLEVKRVLKPDGLLLVGSELSYLKDFMDTLNKYFKLFRNTPRIYQLRG